MLMNRGSFQKPHISYVYQYCWNYVAMVNVNFVKRGPRQQAVELELIPFGEVTTTTSFSGDADIWSVKDEGPHA